MSSPTVGQVHVNVPMTNISVGYTNRRYIAERVLPPVPVQALGEDPVELAGRVRDMHLEALGLSAKPGETPEQRVA